MGRGLRGSRHQSLLRQVDVPAGVGTRWTFDGQPPLWKSRESTYDMAITAPPELTRVHIYAEYQG